MIDGAAPKPVAAAANPGANAEYTSHLLVEGWLRDRGVAFRVKPDADSLGRIVYVLKECPFNAGHGDPDSCIMQAPDGKMAAQCFHNSCRGRGWQEFKDAIGKPNANHYDPPMKTRGPKKKARKTRRSDPRPNSGPAAPPGPPSSFNLGPLDTEPSRRTIEGNKRQLRHVTDDALAAIHAGNTPPRIFQRGGLLTRVRIRAEDGAPSLEPLVDAALRGVLARFANWIKVRDTNDGQIIEDEAPPIEVVKDLAALPAWDQIPIIEGVIECPVFARDGTLVQTAGYHANARLWYQPAAGLQLDPVPEAPTRAEILWARDFLLVELLGDFPFKDEASRAHAVAAAILPFVRQLIDGPTPLHLLDAPVEGTGKTLLASAISLVSTGRDAETIPEADSDEEWRKRLTAILIEAPRFILLDNLNRTLDSGALAAALTTNFWKDRLLGHSKTVNLPNCAVWMASGNNTVLSREMIRRTLWCRLDAKVDAPWERMSFRHRNLLGWAKANRGKLITAVLTICQGWISAARPAGAETLGMFESWAEVVGGILQFAEIPGLLANASEFRRQRADRTSEWRAFVAAWWLKHGDGTVGVEDLFLLVIEEKLLNGELGDKGERSQRTRLGIALGKMLDRVFGDYRVAGAGVDHKQRQQYQLVPVQAQGPKTAEVQQWEA
jgi:putative DNA primase/helicase